MKRKTTSTSRLIFENVVALASELAKRGIPTKGYSSAIESGLSEMVRDNMRRMTQSHIPPRNGGLLERALDESFGRVAQELRRTGVVFDLGQYLKQVQTTLKPVAAEMEKLAERLTYARRAGKLAYERVVGAEERPEYEVREIGLRGLTEGLLVQPTSDDFEIDLDALSAGYKIRGDWFPYEVKVDEFLFILDDDGSIYVSVENFPDRLLVDARAQLEGLARRLYG
jgi:hypothetical protein